MDALVSDRPLLVFEQLSQRAIRDGRATVVGACAGATALVLRALRSSTSRPLIAITRDLDSAASLVADVRFALGESPAMFDPGDQSPYADRVPDRRASQLRMATLYRVARPGDDLTLVVPAQALARKVVPARHVLARSAALRVGGEVNRDALVTRLTAAGYLRVPLVEDPGTLSVRGALLDVWPPGTSAPVRIELDGDDIAAMRAFDPRDQRGKEHLSELELPPAREADLDPARTDAVRTRVRDLCDEVNWPSSKTRSLIEDLVHGRAFFGAAGFLPAFGSLEPLHAQLPDDSIIVIEEPSACARAIDQERARGQNDALEKQGHPGFDVDSFYVDDDELDSWLRHTSLVALCQSPVIGDSDNALEILAHVDDSTPTVGTCDQQPLSRKLAAARRAEGHGAALEPLVEQLRQWRDDGLKVVLTARATSQAERLATMLRHRDLTVDLLLDAVDPAALLRRPAGSAPTIIITVGTLERGVVAASEGIVLLTEEEVFGRRAHRRKVRKVGKRRARQLLDDLRSLTVGEHVVHTDHGVGRYDGLTHRQVGGHTVDMLVVAYAGGDKLYLPVYRLNQVHKFRGSDAAPKLDRLGGQSFGRTKSRTRKKVRDMADQLLALYAERSNAAGIATPVIDDEYRAFEATFPFEETIDQAQAIADVGSDLEAARPMDRLVCGDVGFGKTEVALRAAFRVAMSGRQVAVLCPTTVLAQQHKMTFDARLGAYPIEIAVLSRFQSKSALDAAILGLRTGTVDIAIGTHRLLSKDVHFKHLGLLVVDEEQRFGVAAKERIKALKKNVDVLTLSATPIPRTLQMSISGVRDLSVMATPPADRRAVRTIVTRPDPSVLREAITRELSRGGQVFFVYNRIEGLDKRAALVRQLVPEARIAVVHGRMTERSLERTMLDFVSGSHDVLCTTAIIENGLDIPRANTIIIDGAALLGLTQLYQLRGRVGRSHDRGYCYLVLPPGGAISDESRTRIEALQRYTDLGSGFQIASLDLDLRGCGELLGAEQSGTVAAVGFELFCRMLEEAAAELRGEPLVADVDPELSFDVEALLPQHYVPDVGVRLSFYKRLASAFDDLQLQSLAEELEDRFGKPPPEARRYLHMMAIKTELRRLRVLGCEATAKTVRLHLRDDVPLDPAKITQLLAKTKSYKLTPDMRLTRRASEGEVFANGLAHCDRLVNELRSCAS